MPTRIITIEEAAKLILLPFGKKHPVRILIERLQAGQLLEISRQDFNWQHHTPRHFCTQLEKRGKGRFEVHKMYGNVGWVVKRVE